MGVLDWFRKRDDLAFMYDFELIEDTATKVQLKRLAVQTCVNLIARTISQTEFRIKKNGEYTKNEMYYRFNVRPNLNTSASTFWQTVIYKLVHDNECLIVQSDTRDLLVADSFTRVEYAIYEDKFKDVTVKNYTFDRTFPTRDVIYLSYNNDSLTKLIDGLYTDYGELFGRLIEAQKRKNQIRGIIDIEAIQSMNEERQKALQDYINKIYKAFSTKDVAIVPQQKGFTYEEKQQGSSTQPVDEINKITDGFMDQVARAFGIPLAFLRGDMADVEKQTRNYMTFCIDPLLKKVTDELNAKLFSKGEYMSGSRVEAKRISYSNMFDVATAADKLRSAGIATGNELRDQVGLPPSDDPIADQLVITKNYTESLEGGETNES